MVKTDDSKWLKTELLGIQRWEDEGGQPVERSDLIQGQQPLVHLVAIHVRKYAISLQWNKSWVIEPFQPGNGILREDMNGKGKPND